MTGIRPHLTVGLALLAVCALSSLAQAGLEGPSLALQVRAGQESVDVDIPLVELPPQASDRAKWVMQQVVNVRGQGGGQILARVDELTAEYVADPVIILGFSIQAGALDTTFSIQSATLTFPSLTNPTGEAVIEMLLSDTGGSTGAQAQAVSGNAGMYKATYNGTSLFAELIEDVSFASGGPLGANSSVGPGVINDTISSMKSRVDMTLSAGDTVSGTFTYEIVPEPATISLFSLAGLALIRRRR